MWDFNGFPYLQYTPVDYWDVFPLSGTAYFESSVSPFSATRLMLGNYNVHASSRSDWILSDTKVNYMCVWGTAGKTEQ